MRYLELDDQRYEIIYNGLLNAGAAFDKYEIRLVGKIMEKFEGVGVQGEHGYSLCAVASVVGLEEAEYKLLERVIDGFKWNSRFTKESIAFLDWFTNAPTKPILKVADDTQAAEATS